MVRKSSKRFSDEQKLKIVKEAALPRVRFADICRHYDIYPNRLLSVEKFDA